MRSLIALDVEGGQFFVDELSRAWERGDAVLPVDQRLPVEAKKLLFEELRPTHFVTAQDRGSLADGIPVEEGDALVVATSGSTGKPKGVILTHEAVLASARAGSRALGVDSSDHWYACLPVSHIGGLSVVTKALLMGNGLSIAPRFEAHLAVEASHTCTLVSLVTTALQRIDPRLYRKILLGGSRPPTNRPPNVIATYGMTETGSGIVYDSLPLEGVEISFSLDEEILIRSPMNMRGYRNHESSIDADGWLHTGDIGRLSAEGTLVVDGRRGDVIVTGGEKVWPEPVETILKPLFDRHDFAIVGLPDAEWGQRVVLATTKRDLTLSPVKDLILDSLPNYFVPKEICFLDEIPRTSLGKIRRSEVVRRLNI